MKPTELADIPDLTCRGTTYLVSEGRDRALTADEQARLRKHIENCPECQVASRQFEELFDLLETLFGKGQGMDAA